MALPVCTNLKQIFPGAVVDYLVLEHIAPLFRNHPDVDDAVTISTVEKRHKLLYVKKLLELRRRRYDMVLDLRTDSITVLIALLTGADRRIGFDRGKWRSRLYKTRVPYPETGGSLNAKLSILQGFPISGTPVSEFRVYLSGEELQAMNARMSDHGIDFSRPVFAFSTVSRGNLGSWPVDYFVELIEYVLDRYASQAILIWGPGERELVQAAATLINPRFDVCIDIETGNVRELAALLANSTVFIGNDSGPRHIAEAVEKPTFTIFSPLFSKRAWIPHPGPRHRAVDLEDALGTDALQRVDPSEIARQKEIYYRKITPALVRAQLIPMLDGLCRETSKSNNVSS